MSVNETSGAIVDISIKIHKALGPGLLESVYQRILAYELRKVRLGVETEVPIPIEWEGHVIDESFRADMIINNMVLVELKSVAVTLPVHRKQTLTYVRLAKLSLDLLINFGAPILKEGIHRLANNLPD